MQGRPEGEEEKQLYWARFEHSEAERRVRATDGRDDGGEKTGWGNGGRGTEWGHQWGEGGGKWKWR